MTLTLDIRDSDFEQNFTAFLASKRENAADVNAVVAEILENVRLHGDKAVLDYTNKFDRLDLTEQTMRISAAEIERAVGACNKETLDALYLAAERIEAFHEKQLPENHFFNDETGALLGWRWTPVMAAGL
ncbi:MAG: histidinol dehydrogenase, partial [Alphaproteobacteria bacterium]